MIGDRSEKRDFNAWFGRAAAKAAAWVGSPWADLLAATLRVALVGDITGPYFKYSNTWQLVINTATTIITFVIVFLIQNTRTGMLGICT